MPAYVDLNACDACRERPEPECRRICPADIVHLSATTGKAEITEPDFCWECFACVKACPSSAMGIRGAADVVPLGASIMPRRGATSIAWTIASRNGAVRKFVFPIRTTPWGSIEPFAGMSAATLTGLKSSELCGESAARAQAAGAP